MEVCALDIEVTELYNKLSPEQKEFINSFMRYLIVEAELKELQSTTFETDTESLQLRLIRTNSKLDSRRTNIE
jgi:hypothetical protein